mmetsp:Transcript_40038/g.99073  ORF Transcript_40038/g.99073 Transcript_40038/m.99073 type:complete len:207 (-) Transcript_40038:21-641(-)
MQKRNNVLMMQSRGSIIAWLTMYAQLPLTQPSRTQQLTRTAITTDSHSWSFTRERGGCARGGVGGGGGGGGGIVTGQLWQFHLHLCVRPHGHPRIHGIPRPTHPRRKPRRHHTSDPRAQRPSPIRHNGEEHQCKRLYKVQYDWLLELKDRLSRGVCCCPCIRRRRGGRGSRRWRLGRRRRRPGGRHRLVIEEQSRQLVGEFTVHQW